ncbi:hypothetical protein V8C86DRAFT_2466599 [Haematococcus lacustris]
MLIRGSTRRLDSPTGTLLSPWGSLPRLLAAACLLSLVQSLSYLSLLPRVLLHAQLPSLYLAGLALPLSHPRRCRPRLMPPVTPHSLPPAL